MSPKQAHLRVAATTDIHMFLAGWDSLRDTPDPARGMDRLATLIEQERHAAPGGFVLFDNGDTLQGAQMGEVCTQSPETHPWPAIASALGYDAIGLGNHDFDYGLSFLNTVMSDMTCPVLCASTFCSALACATPTAMLTRSLPCSDGTSHDLQIGVTSVLPPQTAVWNRGVLRGSIGFLAGVEAAQQAVTALRANGADIIVVLSHSGLADGVDATGENFSAAIAQNIKDIDLMILGHTHLRFPGPDHDGFPGVDASAGLVHGVPCVMPGHTAQELGIVDLDLEFDPTLGWRVGASRARRSKIAQDTPPDARVQNIIAPLVQKTRDHFGRVIGHTPARLCSWFSMLRPSRAEALAAQGLIQAASAALQGTDLASLPVLASVAPPAMGGRAGPQNFVHIPPGDVCERHVAMLCPFPNTVSAVVLTGAELWDWLDRSLVFFNDWSDDGCALQRAQAPAFNFDSVWGLEAVIDPLVPPAFDLNGHRVRRDVSRLRSLTHLGQDIHATDRFVLATTSYRASGGGNYPGLRAGTRIVQTDLMMQDALRDVLSSPQPHSLPQPWRFAEDLRCRRTIQTAPQAAKHLSDIAEFNPKALGLDDLGFLRVEVTV